jgi:tetratricopeptide (TPR) repeat protein
LELDKHILELKLLLKTEPYTADKVYDLIDLLNKRGEFAAIEELCSKLIINNPIDLRPHLLLAKNYLESFQFFKAEELLNTLLSEQPDNVDVNLLLIQLMMVSHNYKAARTLAEKIIEMKPDYIDAITVMASLHNIDGNTDKSFDLYNHIIKNEPNNSTAWLGLSNIYYQRGKISIAKEHCKLAIEYDYFNSRAHRFLSHIYFKEGIIDSAEIELLLALKCNNYNTSAHRDLGKGISNQDYSIYPDMEQIKSDNYHLWELITLGNNAAREKDYSKAFKYYKEALKIDNDNIFALLGLGNVNWMTEDYLKAKEAFGNILNKYPGYGIAHNGYYRILSSIADNYSCEKEKAKVFQQNISSDRPAKIDEIFINLDEFSVELQKAVIFSVFPLEQFLEALKESGATFEILPLFEKLTDNPSREYLKGTRIPDTRLWDDVGGNGGINATTGIGSLWDALNFKYNELAHEFAHQIHLFTLTENEGALLDTLYESAISTNSCLDDYAKTSVLEYFAVGYEAFVSQHKRADQNEYYGHTRKGLRLKDEELYRFIKQLTEKSDITENIVAARRSKLQTE